MSYKLPAKLTIRSIQKHFTNIQNEFEPSDTFEVDFAELKTIDSAGLQLLLWLESSCSKLTFLNTENLNDNVLAYLSACGFSVYQKASDE